MRVGVVLLVGIVAACSRGEHRITPDASPDARGESTLATQRRAALERLGRVSEEVLTRLAPGRLPGADGKPEAILWPSSATGALQIVRRADSVMVVTEGLSDPWDPELHADRPAPLGYEIALVVPADRREVASDQALAASWIPRAMWTLADTIVQDRFDLPAALQRYTLASWGLLPQPGLEALTSRKGVIGLLFGQGLDGTVGPDQLLPGVLLLPAKMLTVDEYEWILATEDDTNARKLVDQLATGVKSWPERASERPR